MTDSGWGLGAGAQTPFNYDDTFNGTTKVVRGKSSFVGTGDVNDVNTSGTGYALGGGRGFLGRKVRSRGGSQLRRGHDEKYNYTPVVTPGAHRSSVPSPTTRSPVDAGLLGQPYKWLRAGALYKMGYRIPFNSSHNAGLPVAFSAYNDLKTPDRVLLGLRLSPYDNLRFFLQGRVTFAMKDTFVGGSGRVPGTAGNTVASRPDDDARRRLGDRIRPVRRRRSHDQTSAAAGISRTRASKEAIRAIIARPASPSSLGS